MNMTYNGEKWKKEREKMAENIRIFNNCFSNTRIKIGKCDLLGDLKGIIVPI